MYIENSRIKNYISFWLASMFCIISIMIVVGGLTRLTDSGLSITEWQLFSGFLPPLRDSDWNNYFNLYKKIPEFTQQNYSMTLQDFKVIFWWEWVHRFLGRVIGILFLFPLIFFTYKEGDRQIRYFAEICLFVGVMLGLVIANSFLLMFIFWELVGVCSYLLIGFWYEKPSAASAAKKAFLVTRVGDVFLLLGLVILFNTFGTLRYSELFSDPELLAANATELKWATLCLFDGGCGVTVDVGGIAAVGCDEIGRAHV